MSSSEPTTTAAPTELVFSFGTLLVEKVQQSLFGYRVKMVRDSLIGYGTTEVVITDLDVIAKSGKNVHLGLVRREGGTVSGGLLALTPDELAAADAYEVDARQRIDEPLTLASRRILANSSTLDSITAFHRWEKPLMESTVGWAQLKLRFINRRAAKWAQVRLQNRSPLKLP